MPLSTSAKYNKEQQEKFSSADAPIQGQPPPQQPQNAQEWDYKNNPVNQKGESLPAGAKGWTPTGQAYFGEGIGGTLKRYAWSMMGSPSGQDDDRWERFIDMTDNPGFWSSPFSEDSKQAGKDFAAGVMGKTSTQEQDWNQIREGNARLKQIENQYGKDFATMPAEVAAEYKELNELWGDPTKALQKLDSAASGSLLAPVIRGTKVMVQATLDVLSEAAIKFEQAQGVTSAMRDYAQENSSLPGASFDIDRTQGSPSDQENFWSDPMVAIRSESAQEITNIASRLVLPIVNTWDAFRFWTAPGTLKEKIKVAETGWDAGRVLYSQAIKPSLVEEFKRRAAAGEDPQVLAMELQDPWAEMVGQATLDPLNFIGMFTKGIKAVNMMDKATDAVRGGSLGDEAMEVLAKVDGKPVGETAAAGVLDEFDNILTKNIENIENKRLTVDFNKAGSYSPTGLRIREAKTAQTVTNVATSSIMRNGGTTDDVADFFSDIAKAVSTDKATRLEAWDRLFTMSKRFGLGRYTFSDDVLETGVLLRNLTEDKELITALKAGKGDLFKTAEILNSKFKAALEKQIPSYTQVKNLAAKFEAGEDTSKAAQKAAKTYEGINSKSKMLWNLHEGTAGKVKSAINSTLGKFYFSQPGFAVRNAMGNFTHMFVDGGLRKTIRSVASEGKLWTNKAIDNDLAKWFGGKVPSNASGITMIEAENALTGVSKFNDNIEKGFARRIYWRNFRDTMEKFLQPGVALPKRQEFKAIGMTDKDVDRLVRILQDETYGNVEQAIIKYSKDFGDNGLLQAWKRWDGSVSADEMKGLREFGITKELDDIKDTAQNPQEIKRRIDELRRELMNRANSAADNPIGVNAEREGFEFTGDIGKATEQGFLDVDGTNKLNILIEQSEKASDELMSAIGKARDRYNQMVGAGQAPPFDFSVMEEAFSGTRRGAARKTSQQLTDTAWGLTKKSKKSTNIQAEQLWNQSILAKRGPAPQGLTPQQFRDELWQATRNEVSNNWEMYFTEGFDRLTPVIDNLTEQFPDLAPIFQRSQKASAELNVYRTAEYRGGKIYYKQPPRNVYELANRYGIPTATGTMQEGRSIPQNKQLLATINKYADQKYKTLDEVPLEEAEKALEARRAGAMTSADAARVEQPKATETPATATKTAKTKTKRTTATDMMNEVFDYGGEQKTRAEIIADLKAQGGTPQMIDRYIQGLERSTKQLAGEVVDNVADEAAALTDELGEIKAPTPNPEVQIQPPYVDGSTPIPGQMWKENSEGILNALNKVERHMLDNYGMQAIEKLDGSQLKALKGLMKDANGRITEGIAIADKIGKEWKDFALLPYGETKNFDLALSYAFPYQFWYSRSYANWMKRVATDPQVIANYARIKDSMSRINKDSPEWWRYNVEIPAHFLGLPFDHPMSFPLEANIWPLYGLTGTDFNDPQRRQNWLTATVDDMGKLGPSIWSPIQWAIALGYKAQGEDELAQAWGGRIIPQTASIKALSSYFGTPVELDPGVQLFSGKGIMDFAAMDKYERNRVGRALTAMIQSGEITEEQAVEIARTQEGPAWDEAVTRATQIRAPGQISSFFLGVGMKARTEEDRITDEFYEKYYRLQNLNEADLISPEQYQQEWDGLRDQYPFMDALLLSRKAGPDRDRAYAYNVLGRIPPGQASELYKLVGISPEIAQKFYDSKGNIKDWSQSDRDKFIAATVDLGAMLSIPEYTTKQDWNAAKSAYKGVQAGMKQNFGPDIQDKIDELFSLQDKEDRDAYMQRHPEVQDALSWQNEQVVNDERLYTYYGGIQALEKYHKGKVYDELEKRYGADIQSKWSEYYDMQITDPAGAKSYYRQHPELKAYNKDKTLLMEQALRNIVEFGSKLPDTPRPELQDNEPQSVGQQNIQDYATQQTPDFSYWQSELPEVSAILSSYWTDGEEIPYAVTKNLDYVSRNYGYPDGEAMLQAILISMNR
jgi:hypothetical protein